MFCENYNQFVKSKPTVKELPEHIEKREFKVLCSLKFTVYSLQFTVYSLQFTVTETIERVQFDLGDTRTVVGQVLAISIY